MTIFNFNYTYESGHGWYISCDYYLYDFTLEKNNNCFTLAGLLFVLFSVELYRSILLDLPYGCKVHCKTIMFLPSCFIHFIFFIMFHSLLLKFWSREKEQEIFFGASNSAIDIFYCRGIFRFHHSCRAWRSSNCNFDTSLDAKMYHSCTSNLNASMNISRRVILKKD